MFGTARGDGDVLLRVMRCAERRIGDAAADTDDGHRQVLIAKIVADHLERAVEREGGDRVGEWPQAALRHARGHADHDLLGDAGIDEAIGKFAAEFRDAAGRRNVGDDDAEPRVGLSEFVERIGEAISHAAPSSSSNACLYSSGLGDR